MSTEIFPCRRVAVVGVTGSGKSTLAATLARRFSLDYIELDALYWQPGWVGLADDLFASRVERAVQSPAWALAGNYSRVRPLIWPRAEAVVWLDYSLPLLLRRLWLRTWRRWRSHELLWGTNYERLLPQFKLWSKESLFHWAVRSYGVHQREYPVALARPEHAHLKVFHFSTPAETDAWMAAL